jgi:uncharacterized membrane protein
MRRRQYIDWLRGVAVLVMIEWHALDSWTASDVRDTDVFGWVAFIGGWAAPLFLFLAGVSVALAAASAAAARGARAASWAVQKRGWQIFGIAHLFRLQSFLLNPQASWSGLLKPDILNILGLGMVASAFCWRFAWSSAPGSSRFSQEVRRAAWLLGPAAFVVLLTPASRFWWWPTLLHPRLEAYIRPVGNLGQFQLFPSVALVFAGAFVGSLIATRRPDDAEGRFHLRLGFAGVAVTLAGFVGAHLPTPIPHSDFWRTSTSLVVMRVGAMIAALALAWLWYRRPTAAHWSPLALFGRTSLFVYIVHVELAYGVFSRPIQRALPLGQAVAAYGLLTLLMLGCARLWERRPTGPWIPAHLKVESATD